MNAILRSFPGAAVFAFASLAFGAPAPDFPALCAGLPRDPGPHPYLIFNESEKGRLLARLKSDPASLELWKKLRVEGLSYLGAAADPTAPPREPHPQYVGSDDYLAYMNGHAGAALTLAFLYQMTGDLRYAEKSFAHADRLCALDSWVQSPHRFEVIYPRVWPHGAKDDEVVFTYDITSAAITRNLAYVYDWLYPALTRAQRDRIRSGLLEKAVTRVRGSYEYFWWADASRCNWSGICHSGLGLAALALRHEDPGLTDVIARSCRGVWNLLDQIDPDGGWQEGRGYWAYGMDESVMFMDAIKRASGGRIDFFKHPALKSHPVDFALYGLTAGFGDSTGQPVGSSYLINKLAAESRDPRAAWYSRFYVHPAGSVFDLIWPVPDVVPQAPAEGSKFFRGINWAVLRRDFSPGSLTVACKAGWNDDPHHGHLDCGTFSLTWRNVNFIGEVPLDPYDEQYFGALRWKHLDAMTEAHNVVLVDGEEQVGAKEKDQPWKAGVGGPITQFHSEPGWACVGMDPTHAYPGRHLKSWRRWLVLDKRRNILVVLDRVGAAPGANVEVRFHPNVPFAIAGGVVTLRPADGGPGLAMIPLSNGSATLIQGREADVPFTKKDTSSSVPYFSTTLPAPARETVIASIFAPGGPAAPADARLSPREGAWQVSFSVGGQPEAFAFDADAVTKTAP